MNRNKLLSVLLVLALLLSTLSVTAFAQSPVYYAEGHCLEPHPARKATAGPVLAPGNHERYVDRLAAMPDYALEYYRWLEDNMGIGGALVDPTAGTSRDQYGYYHHVTTIQKTKHFNFAEGDVVKTIAGDVATIVMEEEFASFLAYIGAIWDAFDRDHPEVFWLNGKASYSYYCKWWYNTVGANTATVTCELKMVVYMQQDGFDVRYDHYCDPLAVANAMDYRDLLISQILEDCPEGTAYEQLGYLNDVLTKKNAYNSVVALGTTDGVDDEAWECISALEGRSGAAGPVCEGYARAYKVLCDELQIPCVLVDGTARDAQYQKPSGHMWNYVQLNGSWYAVDPTWNDPFVISRPTVKVSGHESREWFLLGSDTQIAPGLSFLASHEAVNAPSLGGMSFTNGPVRSAARSLPSETSR